MVSIPLRFSQVHDRQRPWRLTEAAPPAAERTPFAAVYGPNVVRQDFSCPADNLRRLSLWMAGPVGQAVTITLHDRASGERYAARLEIVHESGQYYDFVLPGLSSSKGKDLSLLVSAPDATDERAIVLRISPGDRVGGLAHLNMYPVSG